MRKRIPLDPEHYAKPSEAKVRGVAVQVFVSPYDVPTEVTGGFDEKLSRFAIDFQYPLSDEPTEVGQEDGVVTLRVGKHSQRLYRIEIDTHALNADAVELKVLVDRGLQGLLASAPRTRSREHRVDNYRIARSVVEEKADELLTSVR
jgi:hypothetical protein